MQSRGVSPRPANTEYYRPGFREANKLYSLSIPKDIFTLIDSQRLISDSETTSSSSSTSVTKVRKDSPKPVITQDDESKPALLASSPSVARSPAVRTKRAASVSRKVPLPTPLLPSNKPAPDAEDKKEVLRKLFDKLGIIPHQIVSFETSGDELVIVTNVIFDKVAILFDKGTRAMTPSEVFTSTPFIKLSETVISDDRDAERQGADLLKGAVEVVADKLDISPDKLISGTLSGSDSNRFVLMLNRFIPSADEEQNNHRKDVFVYAQTKDAIIEFARGDRSAKFVYPHFVIPVIEYASLKFLLKNNLIKDVAYEFSESLRSATEICEEAYGNAIFSEFNYFINRFKTIKDGITKLQHLIPKLTKAKQDKISQIFMQMSQDTTKNASSHMAQFENMMRFSSSLQESVGRLMSVIETSLVETELFSDKIIGDLYTETRMKLAPDVTKNNSKFAKALEWGLPSNLDSVSFKNISDAQSFISSGAGPKNIEDSVRHHIISSERSS